MGRVRLLWGVPCYNSPSSHMELCPPGLAPPSSETLPTRPASLPPRSPRAKGGLADQLPACYCFISSHRQDHLWMQGRIMSQKIPRGCLKFQVPRNQTGKKTSISHETTLLHSVTEVTPVYPHHLLKCTSSVLILQLWGFLFREAHMHPFGHNLVSWPF